MSDSSVYDDPEMVATVEDAAARARDATDTTVAESPVDWMRHASLLKGNNYSRERWVWVSATMVLSARYIGRGAIAPETGCHSFPSPYPVCRVGG